MLSSSLTVLAILALAAAASVGCGLPPRRLPLIGRPDSVWPTRPAHRDRGQHFSLRLASLRGGGDAGGEEGGEEDAYEPQLGWGDGETFGQTEEARAAWLETKAYRKQLEEEEKKMDSDLRNRNQNVLDWLDEVKRKREQSIKDELEKNGPAWVPEINRHFMDPDNYTTDLGPEHHPPYPCVPTLAMRDPSTRMRESACRGRTDELLSLIENDGAVINKPDEVGRYAAIHWAALMGHPETLEAIITHGGDVAAVTRYRRTALHYAAEQGHLECVNVLMAAGAPLEALDKSGRSPATLAAFAGQSLIAEMIGDQAAQDRAAQSVPQPTSHPVETLTSALEATSLASPT